MRSMRESNVTPALATRTSTGPQRPSMAPKAASTSPPLRTSQGTARKWSGPAPSGGFGSTERYVVATWSPLARNHRTHAAPIPRVPPVTRTTAISRRDRGRAEPDEGLTLLDPLPVCGQPADDLSVEGRSHLRDADPPDKVADVHDRRRVEPLAGRSRQQSRAGRLQRGLRGEDAARRADDDALGHVEVLALVQCGLGAPRARRADPVDQGVEVLRLGHGERLDLGQAALGQPAQHAARPELDERRQCRVRRTSRASGATATGLQSCADRRPGQSAGSSCTRASTLATTRTSGVRKDASASALRRSDTRPSHQRGVEGARDLDRHHPLGAQAPWPARRPTATASGVPGDDDLAGRVVVGHPHVALGPLARGLGVVVGDAEQRGHRARRLFAGAGHGLAPRHDEADPVLEAEGAAGHQRGVLAEAVAGAGGWREADPFDRVEHDQAEDGRGQLGVLGLGELLDRRVEEQAGQVPPGGLRRLVDHLPGRVIDPRSPHAGAL